MERLTTGIYTFKGKVEDAENEYLIKVQQKLKEYEDLEEQGRLLKLPCEVGDEDVIEQTAAEYNNDWIPVEERLPEESNFYCVTTEDMETGDRIEQTIWFAHKDDYDMDESEWRELCDYEKVVAWKKSAPYQSKESEPNTCTETDYPYNDGKDCPAAVGHEPKEPCFHCDHTEPGDKRIPMTNGDLIRSMSDEELAMSMTCPNENESGENICDKRDDYNCYECLLKWLQSEAER